MTPITDAPTDGNGWGQWSRKVLADIERLEEKQNAIQRDINGLSVDIAVLKTK